MDHYRTLGLSKNASKEEIKEAFRRSALKFHPDKHSQSSTEVRDGASLRFKQASEAYEVLSDDRKRADYDLARRFGRTPSPSNSSSPSSSYGGFGGRSDGYYRPPPPREGLDVASVFRYVTRRGFLVNVAFASALLGGAVVIEKSGEALWKMNNSGLQQSTWSNMFNASDAFWRLARFNNLSKSVSGLASSDNITHKSFEDALQSVDKGKTCRENN